MNAAAGERIQKLLASWGHGSRRGIEEWLRAGRITVNGRVAALGDRALPGDVLALDGRPLAAPVAAPQGGSAAVLLYHKPLGEVTTRSDPEGRPTVFDRLPPPPAGRWVVVGRLDVNTSGLLLFTNDGALAHRLMHPSFEAVREYLVRVRGTPTPATLEQLRRGLMLEDGPARFDRLEALPGDGPGRVFRVALHEGRNREVRRLWEAAGHEVSRLKRISYAGILLPEDLPAGQARLLPPPDLRRLAEMSPNRRENRRPGGHSGS